MSENGETLLEAMHDILQEVEDEKYYVQLAMRKFGGSFVNALGEALRHADIANTLKIKHQWPEFWQEYLDIGREEFPNERPKT